MKIKVSAREIVLAESANAHLFNGELVAEPFSIVVTGRPSAKDKEGKSKYRFMQTTNPNEDAKKVGVIKSRYFNTAFRTADNEVEFTTATGNTRKARRGSRKNTQETTFENVSPNLFTYVRDEIKEGNYRELGTNTNGDMLIEIDGLVYGKVLKIVTPVYKLTKTDENGKREPLLAGTYDHEQKRYIKRAATNDNITMFVEEDDFNGLISLISKRVEKEVLPFLVSTVTIKEQTATASKTTTMAPGSTPDEELDLKDDTKVKEEEEEEPEIEETDDDEDKETV